MKFYRLDADTLINLSHIKEIYKKVGDSHEESKIYFVYEAYDYKLSVDFCTKEEMDIEFENISRTLCNEKQS